MAVFFRIAFFLFFNMYGVSLLAATTESAADFSEEAFMGLALDEAEDVNQEQINYSRFSGQKKAQEYLVSIANELRAMMRNIERNVTSNNLTAEELGTWVSNWARSELLYITVTPVDGDNLGENIYSNTGFNITIKFAKEHHIHSLDSVTFRFVPELTESQDQELSINGWYCRTDVDYHDFSRHHTNPAEAGTQPLPGQSMKGEMSRVLQDLPFPYSQCVVASSSIEVPYESDAALYLGIDRTDTTAPVEEGPPEID